ncbi:hypothetical protein [Paenibacillus tepidiphilus]|uniref:hypothetical protein n=1 Tax=Paenibacillus tepidiphilus TaxID=2608683 RepID=UPI001238EBB4|nr:hypothetical protein [Paenibacillus tepidiphilus]
MHLSILKFLDPDVLIDMIELAEAAEQWHKMLYITNVLRNYAQRIYEERQYCKAAGKPVPPVKMDQPLIYYFGYSEQMRGMAYMYLGEYEQAVDSIYRYAELGWMEDLGEEGQAIAREFRFIAKVNLYAVGILSGQTELVNDYVLALQSCPQGILDGLTVIVQAALRYGLNVDGHLDQLNSEVRQTHQSVKNSGVQIKIQRLQVLIAQYNEMRIPCMDSGCSN